MFARVTVNFFPYNTAGSKGVGCGLGNVLKTRDGEPLSGGASAASDFADLGQSFSAQQTIPQPQQATASVYPQAPYSPVAPQRAVPQAYAAPTQPQSRPAVNPITGQAW